MIIELVIQNWIDFGVLTAIQFGNATLGWYVGLGSTHTAGLYTEDDARACIH